MAGHGAKDFYDVVCQSLWALLFSPEPKFSHHTFKIASKKTPKQKTKTKKQPKKHRDLGNKKCLRNSQV